jgi:translocator protein
MMKSKRILMVLSLIVVLVVNILANSLPINGVTTAEVSDQFPILFVPAGYVFSIWGLIYLAQIGFVIYSLTPKGQQNKGIDAIAWWFVASNFFNAAWVVFWHYQQFALTLIPIFGLLISLIMIYNILRIGKETRATTEKFLVSAPFSIYLGWATVAVVANVSQFLYSSGWRGAPLTEAIWTVVMLAVASLLGVLMIFLRREVAYPLVLVWAFVGIWVKHGAVPLVAITALTLAIILASLTLIKGVMNLKSKPA